TALNDSVINLHPCRGVKTPPVPVKEYQILSPDEINRLLTALPTDTARLLAEVAIESGPRWGELAEMRPADLNTSTGVLTASRARRRQDGHDQPRGPRAVPDSDGHLPRNWWRVQVWTPACAAAALHPRPRMHDLRHSHASWLLTGGADLQTVKDRLGHQSITT